MESLARPVIALYNLSDRILATSIQDLSDQDARARSRAGAGPSVAWIIGHLCHFKIQVLELLGQSRTNPFAAQFERTAASDGEAYPPLTELVSTFSALNSEVCSALESSAARLETTVPGGGLHQERTLLDAILFFAWHEAYHIGALGAIRRDMGRRGIAELVLAAPAA
jgi:uncharacterized damage-inducible protein DinB